MPVHADRKACERESKRIILAMGDGRARVADRGLAIGLLQTGSKKQAMMAHRCIAVRKRIRRLERDRTFEQHERLGDLGWHAGINVRLGAQDEIIGIQAVRPLAPDPVDLGAPQAGCDRTDGRRCDVVLEGEDVFGPAVKSLGPYVHASRRIDQLTGDADQRAGLADTAFQHVAYAKFAADLLHVHRAALVRERGIPRDHEQPVDAREAGDDVVDHPVGKIVLLLVAAQVRER
ncbi:hypothetical protein ACVL5V_006499 [Bradyrhizobium ottawaense]